MAKVGTAITYTLFKVHASKVHRVSMFSANTLNIGRSPGWQANEARYGISYTPVNAHMISAILVLIWRLKTQYTSIHLYTIPFS